MAGIEVCHGSDRLRSRPLPAKLKADGPPRAQVLATQRHDLM
jgi:hypothetical protein